MQLRGVKRTEMSRDKRIAVIGTGGTIASRYDATRGRTVASEEIEEILTRLPDQKGLPQVVLENLATIPSFNMTTEFAHRLVLRVGERLQQPDIDGVVVTQGTDTLEETSFLADILIDSKKPIVFTGAQLAHDHPQSDGPRNLLDSIRAAAADDTIGLGALICFNGELHAGRDVTKIHTSALETFHSYSHGAVGVVDGKAVVIERRPQLRIHLAPKNFDKRVELIKAVLGIDARVVDTTCQAGVDGLVVEAFGRGNVSIELGQRLGRACRDGLPVIVTSRSPVGRVAPVYGGGGGGGRDLADAGAIFAGDLKGPKARLLLMAALGDPNARSRLHEVFRAIAP
jgi:L-asparaginase